MNDWIEWKGGACPVDLGERVEATLRDGWSGGSTNAGLCRWNHDGTSGDIIAYRLAQPQAHMMSLPPKVHDLCLLENCLAHPQLHIAQDAGLPGAIEYMPPPDLRAALDAKDVEIARLTAALKRANDQAEHFEREWYLRGDELEQLRKASDGPDMGAGHDVPGGLLNRVHDHALDHRLGIAQPEGEPCEPRTWRRVRPMV
jgi:hypothetical protein